MVVMVLSVISLQLNIAAARDSALKKIQEGLWQEALEYAEMVIEESQYEYLLLGLFHFAHLSNRIPGLDPQIAKAIDENKFRILHSWEDFDKSHENNINILNVLMILHSEAYRTGAYEYARRVFELDSLNGFAQYILGHSAMNEGKYELAIANFLKAVQLDTSLHSAYSGLATIYLVVHEYDSSIAYYDKAPYKDALSNSEHIGEVICEVAKGNIEAAEELCGKLRQLETTWFVKTSLNFLSDYFSAFHAAKLAESDSFVILGPLIGGRIPLRPLEWVAILTADTIDLVVDPNITKPEPIFAPAPKYPRSAREAGIGGRSIVLAHIDADGMVLNVELQSSSGNNGIDNAALECVRKWEFSPARVFSVPIRYWAAVPINFRITH